MSYDLGQLLKINRAQSALETGKSKSIRSSELKLHLTLPFQEYST